MTEYFRMMANRPRLSHALFALSITSRCKPEDYKPDDYKIDPASPFPPIYVGSHKGSTDPQSIHNSKSPSPIASVRPSARSQHDSATASALQVSTRKQQTAKSCGALQQPRRNPQNQASFESDLHILSFYFPIESISHNQAHPPSSATPLLTTSTSSFPNAPLSVQSVLVKTLQVGKWGYRASAAAERI